MSSFLSIVGLVLKRKQFAGITMVEMSPFAVCIPPSLLVGCWSSPVSERSRLRISLETGEKLGVPVG